MFVAFCRWVFRRNGWKVTGQLPDLPKYIVLVGPHTSSWDFIYGVAARDYVQTDIRFLGKKELFKFPFKNFFLSLGGFPVNRQANEKAVDATIRIFKEMPEFRLALSPEGTRGKVSSLRSGFYHIARGVNIPYVLVGLNYATRTVEITEAKMATGTWEEESDFVVRFFRNIKGKNPELGIS